MRIVFLMSAFAPTLTARFRCEAEDPSMGFNLGDE